MYSQVICNKEQLAILCYYAIRNERRVKCRQVGGNQLV